MNRKSFALAFREMPDHLIPPKPGQPALIDQPPASPPDPPQLDPAPPDPPTLDPPPPDPRPRRWRLMGLGLILLIVLIAAVYLLTPLLPGGLLRSNESPGNRIMMRMIDVFVVIWIVWVGIAIGSFLNVVAYRLPAGKPLGGRSHCPRCDSQLTWRDNTPVFGWLLLGGQCRHCGGAISRRYPTVEFLVGISIAAVVIPRLYNVPLPHDSTHWFRGHFGGHSLTDPMMWTRLLLHVIALATLWAMALIRWDAKSVPPALFGVILVICVSYIAMPSLPIETWRQRTDLTVTAEIWRTRLDAAMLCITAIVSATLMARSLARGLSPRADLKLDPLGKSTRRLIDLIGMLALVSLVVGWQSSIAVVVVASVGASILPIFEWSSADPLGRMAAALPMVLAGDIGLWHWLHGKTLWPSDGSDPLVVLGWAVAALCIPIWLGRPNHDDSGAS